MAYTADVDLEFLSKCSNDDLATLFEILTQDKKGSRRLTEGLTKNEKVMANRPNHTAYWDLIAGELQKFGANTFISVLRGGGVEYKEILKDVCNKMKVNYNSSSDTKIIEMNLLLKVLTDSVEKMSPEELKILVKDLDLKTTKYSKQAIIAGLQASVNLSGFMAYRLSVVVANAVAKAVVGRGLSFAANAGLTRVIGVFAGPIGWGITSLWTLVDIAGPAYRVTMPAVIQVAYMRVKLSNNSSQSA